MELLSALEYGQPTLEYASIDEIRIIARSLTLRGRCFHLLWLLLDMFGRVPAIVDCIQQVAQNLSFPHDTNVGRISDPDIQVTTLAIILLEESHMAYLASTSHPLIRQKLGSVSPLYLDSFQWRLLLLLQSCFGSEGTLPWFPFPSRISPAIRYHTLPSALNYLTFAPAANESAPVASRAPPRHRRPHLRRASPLQARSFSAQ